jgi:hypothetical protein
MKKKKLPLSEKFQNPNGNRRNVLGVSRKVSVLVYVLGVSILSLFLRFPFGFWNFSESGNFFFFISLNVTITKLITQYVFCHPICSYYLMLYFTRDDNFIFKIRTKQFLKFGTFPFDYMILCLISYV